MALNFDQLVQPFDVKDIVVGNTRTLLCEIPLECVRPILKFGVENVLGGVGLSDFQIDLQNHPAGKWFTYMDKTALADPTNGNVISIDDPGPHELPAGEKSN